MAERIYKAGKKTVAVVDFVDLQGNVTELGRFLAEEFSVNLAAIGKGFEIVDRTHLKTLLKEHKLVESGIIDPLTAKKLGKIAGVDAVVTGTITPFGDSVRLSVKILDTSTAKVIDASSTSIAKTKAIEELLGKGVETETQTSTPSPERKTLRRVDAQEFTFEVQSCRSSGQAVTCYLTVTNKGNDTVLQFGYGHRTRIIDDNGNEYHMETVRLGNQQNQRYEVQNKMVSDISVKASLTFEKVSPQIGRINLLEIGCARNFNAFSVQFRNISLSR
jgi:TolB-like protein